MRGRRLPARMPRDVVLLLGLALTYLSVVQTRSNRWGVDSHAYWAAWRGSMYDQAPNTLDAFLYSPAFAQLLWPFVQLPWPVFGTLWALVAIAALAHLFRPLGWRWAVPLLLCCSPEIIAGNVFWLLAVVAAYGARWPALWAIPLLTKITPGIGLLWFLVRREWRPLLIAGATTAAIAAASCAVDPGLWREWVQMLTSNAGAGSRTLGGALMPPLVVRFPLAVALVVWAALTDRRWGVPAAMVLATPVTGIAVFAILAALPRLHEERDETTAVHEVPTGVGSVH